MWSGFNDQHVRVIQQHYMFLLDNLVVSKLVDELYQADVLSAGETEAIGAEVTLTAQNKMLLSVLNRKTKAQFDQFLDALDKTGQQHVRNKISAEMKCVSYYYYYFYYYYCCCCCCCCCFLSTAAFFKINLGKPVTSQVLIFHHQR